MYLLTKAEDLDVLMPIYNLINYSKNYGKATGCLYNFYRDEANNPPADNYNADHTTNSISFKYKSNIIRKTPDNGNG